MAKIVKIESGHKPQSTYILLKTLVKMMTKGEGGQKSPKNDDAFYGRAQKATADFHRLTKLLLFVAFYKVFTWAYFPNKIDSSKRNLNLRPLWFALKGFLKDRKFKIKACCLGPGVCTFILKVLMQCSKRQSLKILSTKNHTCNVLAMWLLKSKGLFLIAY